MASFSTFQRFLAALSLLIFLLPLDVLAGHSLWEYKPLASRNTTFHQLERRAHWIRPSASSLIWPDRTIKYCFDTTAARDKLDSYIQAAMELWHAAGLPPAFQMKLVNRVECALRRKDRLKVFDTPGVLSCTPGLQRDKTEGPVMHLTTDTSIGSLDIVANIAHEIGHAWGLLHPHQVSTLWAAPLGTNFQSLLKFTPENLKDYQKFWEAGDDAGDPEYIKGLCTDYAKAVEAGFSGAEFLSMGGKADHDMAIPSDSSIDWDSIMWYPTGAGGRGAAGPGPGNDHRLPVLQRIRENGVIEDIPVRVAPSLGDVQALIKLYELHEKHPTPQLHSDPKSSRFGIFKGMSSCKLP